MHLLCTFLYKNVVRETIIPFTLLVSTTALAVTLPFITIHKQNSFGLLLRQPEVVLLPWKEINLAQPHLWCYLLSILSFGIISILWLPGPKYNGPQSYRKGFKPTYRDTAFIFYIFAMVTQVPLLLYFPILPWYNQLVSLAACFVLVGFITSFSLFVKGHIWPSPGERTITMNPLFDFYTGIELYPRIGHHLDLKQLINCRFGMWLWQLHILAALKVNYEIFSQLNYRLAVNVILQTIYIAKFFYWESGYMQTIDIALDHLGYYVGWGCIVWVPLFYTLSSVSSASVAPDNSFSNLQAGTYLVLGLICIWLNYETDAERQRLRAAWQDGRKPKIWGHDARVILVRYANANGQKHSSILIADGFWGWARHINYLFELLAAFTWSTVVSNSGFQVYFYFLFLSILLVHRAHRDEVKCSEKYGAYWEKYKQLVPYRIVPYVY